MIRFTVFSKMIPKFLAWKLRANACLAIKITLKISRGSLLRSMSEFARQQSTTTHSLDDMITFLNARSKSFGSSGAPLDLKIGSEPGTVRSLIHGDFEPVRDPAPLKAASFE